MPSLRAQRSDPDCLQAIAAAGAKVDTFDLPKMGIKGNTHMMMMDRNSDDIAKLVNDWI